MFPACRRESARTVPQSTAGDDRGRVPDPLWPRVRQRGALGSPRPNRFASNYLIHLMILHSPQGHTGNLCAWRVIMGPSDKRILAVEDNDLNRKPCHDLHKIHGTNSARLWKVRRAFLWTFTRSPRKGMHQQHRSPRSGPSGQPIERSQLERVEIRSRPRGGGKSRRLREAHCPAPNRRDRRRFRGSDRCCAKSVTPDCT